MELRTEIEIDAAPSAVWAVLTDFPRFRDWNPFIASVSGEAKVGERLEVVLSPPEGREMTFRPTVLVVDPERELRWLGHLFFRGLFDGEHFFRLVEVTKTRTRFVHGENFSGILVKPFTQTLTKTARGFVYMNQAIKRRVESLPQESAR